MIVVSDLRVGLHEFKKRFAMKQCEGSVLDHSIGHSILMRGSHAIEVQHEPFMHDLERDIELVDTDLSGKEARDDNCHVGIVFSSFEDDFSLLVDLDSKMIDKLKYLKTIDIVEVREVGQNGRESAFENVLVSHGVPHEFLMKSRDLANNFLKVFLRETGDRAVFITDYLCASECIKQKPQFAEMVGVSERTESNEASVLSSLLHDAT